MKLGQKSMEFIGEIESWAAGLKPLKFNELGGASENLGQPSLECEPCDLEPSELGCKFSGASKNLAQDFNDKPCGAGLNLSKNLADGTGEQAGEGLNLAVQSDLNGAKFNNVAFVCVDMINGFCCEGALSSPRVGAMGDTLARTFKEAYVRGLRNFVLIQDSHEAGASEFDAFPPHALAGTNEAQTVEQIRNLGFFDEMKIFYKNSISSAYCDGFNEFLAQNPHIDTFVVFGDCTDLCVYNLALHLKLSANERNLRRRVIVPANLVATYDAPWHDGDFYQLVFLHHMKLAANIEIVAKIEI